MIATTYMCRLHKRKHKKQCNTRQNKDTIRKTTKRKHLTALGLTFMAAGTQLYFLPLLAEPECTVRSLTPISCLIHLKTKPEPGGSSGPGQARLGWARSTSASPQEFRGTCSNSRQNHSSGAMKARRIKILSCSLEA